MSRNSIRCLGFTLTELLVTVAIVAILLGIAIPSFTALMQRNRLTTITNSFVTSLSYARNEAIKRGAQVTMANKGADGDWSSGWDICVDGDADDACATADVDTLLRTADAVPSGYSIGTSGEGDYQTFAGFIANGLPKNTAFGATFDICQGSNGSNSRQIVINATGRASVKPEGEGSCS